MLSGMGEKRRSKRHPRRLKVRFGEHQVAGFPHVGITSDFSDSGLFVICTQRIAPGTRLHLEVTLQDEKPLYAEVVVARQVLVPPELRQVVHAGFGARFLTGPELVRELVPSLSAERGAAARNAGQASGPPGASPPRPPPAPAPFTQVYDSEPVWREAVEKELRRGGVFLWHTSAMANDTLVTVTFELRYAGRTLTLPARVVHSLPGADGRHGVALMFTEATAAAAITATLE